MWWVFHFSNELLGQEPLDTELLVSWSIATVENLNHWGKFRHFSKFIFR